MDDATANAKLSATALTTQEIDVMVQAMGEGLSSIEQVRAEAPEVPILVLSPWDLDREKAFELGATACVSKPVDYATVLKLTDLMVSRAAAQRWASLVGERD